MFISPHNTSLSWHIMQTSVTADEGENYENKSTVEHEYIGHICACHHAALPLAKHLFRKY
jgi:hypothetical protein